MNPAEKLLQCYRKGEVKINLATSIGRTTIVNLQNNLNLNSSMVLIAKTMKLLPE